MQSRTTLRIMFAGLTLACSRRDGMAQSEHLTDRPHIEIDYDLRTRLPSQGRTRTELTDRSIRASSGLGSGVKLEVYGADKYGGFLVQNFVTVAASLGIIYHPPGWDIILPVGISFYTFATLSYTLDVYLRRSKPAGCPTSSTTPLCGRSAA